MPKILEHMRETILLTARTALLEAGYEALTMRSVAEACGVAVGTLYNYFPSKEMLVAEILLEDWRQALEDMRRDSRVATDVVQGLTAIYASLQRFYGRYRDVWAGYSYSPAARTDLGRRRGELVTQLAGIVEALLVRLGTDAGGGVSVIFAENMLICAGGSAMTFDAFLRIVERICR